MKQEFIEKSPYPQPSPKMKVHQVLNGLEEDVDFLPGTSIRVWYTYLPTSYPMHWHSCMEIIEGVHSYYNCETGDGAFTVSPGDILLIPGGVVHNLTPGPRCNGWVYLFETQWMEQIPSFQNLSPIPAHPLLISQQGNPLLYMDISGWLSRMRNDYFSENEARELVFNASVLRLMEQLALHGSDTGMRAKERLDKRHIHEAMFQQVIDYIDQNFSKDLTLDDISRQFNLSNAYFSRLFSKYVQEPFSDYLTHRRLREAESLLADPALSITDVALRCGYGSLSSFSRVFLAQKNCTPSQFRRNCVRLHRGTLYPDRKNSPE